MTEKTFKVSVDSMIDIITNSSTEIYTYPASGAQEQVKRVIDAILKEAGSALKFDDLFTCVKVVSQRAEEDFHYWLEYGDGQKEIGSDTLLNKKTAKAWIAKHKEEADKLFLKWLDNNEKFSYNREMAYDLEIRNKSGVNTGLSDMIQDIFESSEADN